MANRLANAQAICLRFANHRSNLLHRDHRPTDRAPKGTEEARTCSSAGLAAPGTFSPSAAASAVAGIPPFRSPARLRGNGLLAYAAFWNRLKLPGNRFGRLPST